jgi:hypothetical protein
MYDYQLEIERNKTRFVLPKKIEDQKEYEQLLKLRRSAELFAPEDKKLIEALDKLLKNYTETTNPK